MLQARPTLYLGYLLAVATILSVLVFTQVRSEVPPSYNGTGTHQIGQNLRWLWLLGRPLHAPHVVLSFSPNEAKLMSVAQAKPVMLNSISNASTPVQRSDSYPKIVAHANLCRVALCR